MRNYRLFSSVPLLVAVLLLSLCSGAVAASVPRISSDELKSRLGEANLVILDVRSNWDWGQSGRQIVGSERVNPAAAVQWADRYPKDKVIVLYCA